jgi:hypothetical protein
MILKKSTAKNTWDIEQEVEFKWTECSTYLYLGFGIKKKQDKVIFHNF